MKDIRILSIICPLSILILVGCSGQKSENQTGQEQITEVQDEVVNDNQLTEVEKTEGWRLLFDGSTLNGWHKFKADSVGEKWQAQDGILFFAGDEENESEARAAEGGDILTDDEFSNYELNLEWKISSGGNSGIIYNIIESNDYKEIWHTGPEMQIVDNAAHPDAQIDKHRAGDLYDLIACSEETVRPAGEWNQVRLIVNNGNVQHWLNGVKVVEVQFWTPEWDELVAGSKFSEKPDFGTARKGRIALQDHHNQVWFRNIKIKEL